MNRGEGLKIAARAKHGTGLFPEEKKAKKKFGYRSRNQAFTVRKPQTNTDTKDVGRQPGAKSETKRTATHGRHQENGAPRKNARADVEQKARPGNSGKKAPGGRQKKETVDPIRKNKYMGAGAKTGGGTSSGIGGADTIALTQGQLNAILQSIGAATGETPAISIENGQVKLRESSNVPGQREEEELDEADEREGMHGTKREPRGSRDGEADHTASDAASENVLQLLQDLELDSNRAGMDAVPEVPISDAGAERKESDQREESDREKTGGNAVSKKDEFAWGNSGGMGNIGAVIGSQRELSAQERKKLEWKKALEEQMAQKKRQRDNEKTLRKSLDDSETGLFHQNPPPRQSERMDVTRTFEKKDPVKDMAIVESSFAYAPDQSNVPAAMRSNFSIGGPSGPTTEQLKRKEKQEWIRALEQQKREAAEIKEQERRRRQEEDAKIGHWTDQAKPSPRNVYHSTTDDHPQSKPVGSTSRVASVATNPVIAADIISPRNSTDGSFARGGSNSLVDPAEQERRGMAKKKHLEHMQAVQQQVEERQRVKREAEEKRRREEAMEEQRLAAERDDLQKQFDLEKEKQRQKEEAAAAKQRALEDSIQNAKQEALAAKHAKRMQRLNQQGHDTSHLRKSWDAQHPVEASPRQVVHSSQQANTVQQSPPPPPLLQNGSTQNVTPDSLGASISSGGMRDAATSTISDQSTQTGYFDIESLSPGIIEAIRQGSAGIEYRGSTREEDEHQSHPKPPRRKEEGHPKTEKTASGRSKKEPNGRRTKDASTSEKANVANRKKVVEKPKWGQNVSKKRVSNSDKDLSSVGKGREDRRRRRQEELLAQQERLMQRRGSLKKRPPSREERGVSNPPPLNGQGARANQDHAPMGHSNTGNNEQREHSVRGPVDYHRTEDVHSVSVVGDGRGRTGEDLTGMEGDFYPFMRSEDHQLTNRSVTVTPEVGEHWRGTEENTYIDTDSYQPQPPLIQMDPLLNPGRLKDTGQRQERILEQLSHLRQGLMMKQREIELGLSPTMI